MKKVKGIEVSNVILTEDGRIQATLRITGSLKQAEVNPKWIVPKLVLTVNVNLPAEDVLKLFGSDLRIDLANDLRKCDEDFLDSINGFSGSLTGLEARISAAIPPTAGNGAKAENAKLRAVLKGTGMTDEEIDRRLAEVA